VNLGVSSPTNRFGLWLFVIVLAVTGPAFGQPLLDRPASPPVADEPSGAPRGLGLRNVKPDVFLWDRDGELVLVPDFSFEEFERLYQQDLRMQGPVPPPYILQETRVQGVADGSVAQIEVRTQVLLLRDAERPLKVPLQLHPAILQDIQYEGSGEAVVTFDRELPGYVCWLRGKEQSQHSITLKMGVRLRQIGDDTRFEMQLPDARAHVELTTSLQNLEVRAADDQYVVELQDRESDEGSRIVAEGLGGDFRLDWRATQRSAAPAHPLLNAKASVTVTCEEPTYLLAEAQIEVRVDRGALSTFHVQLPPGMTLTTREVVGYSLEIIPPEELLQASEEAEANGPSERSAPEASDEAGDSAGEREASTARLGPQTLADRGQVVRVEMLGTRERTATLQLDCEYARPSQEANEPFELVGFTVLEAFQQRTDLVIAVEGEWSLQIVNAENVRRVGNLTEAQRDRGVVSKHVYFQNPAQSNSLQVTLQPQASLIHVDPTYLLRVREQQVRLDAVLRFRVRGATARNLSLTFPDWNLLDIQPTEILADQPEVRATEEGGSLLVLPIDLRQVRGDEFELRVSAEKRQESGDQRLTLSLPVPQASQQPADQTVIMSPATVMLTSSDSLELSPVSGQMPELYSVARTTTVRLPEELKGVMGERAPLIFQSAATANQLRVVADIRRRPQVVTSSSRVRLRAEQNLVQVEQEMTLLVEHKPLRSLQFELAGISVPESELTLSLDDEVVPMERLDFEVESDRTRFEFQFPAERIGEMKLQFTYSWPFTLPEDSASLSVRVPLVTLSRDLPIIRARTVAVVVPGEVYQCSVEGDEWLPTDELEIDGTSVRGLQTNRLAPDVRLRMVAIRETLLATEVRQAWIQTLLTRQLRFDRAVFQFTSSEDRCEVRLPAGDELQMGEVMVALNGHRVEFSITGRSVLEIPLAPSDATRQHTLEVWYAFDPRPSGPGAAAIEVARLQGDSRWTRSYWQLVTPRKEHLLWTPLGLADESRWVWKWLGYGRQPRLDQAGLEAWMGAVETEALPREMNTYLFSAIGPLPEISLRTASRGWLVLIGSGVLLMVGMGWIYLPLARHPVVLMVFAVGVAALGALQPGLGILLAQSASAGLLLLLVAGVLDRLFVRRPVISLPPPPVASSDSVRSQYTATTAGFPTAGPLSTTAGPYGLDLSSGEPNTSAG
jgi:hypothetical protein